MKDNTLRANIVLIVIFLPGIKCAEDNFANFIIIAYIVWLACFLCMLLLFFKYCYEFIKRRMMTSNEDLLLPVNDPTDDDRQGHQACPPDGRPSGVTPPPSYSQALFLRAAADSATRQRGMLRSYGTMPTRFHAPVTVPMPPPQQPTHGNSPPPAYDELFPRVHRTSNRRCTPKTRT